jgi:hypothetical protein
VAGALPEAALTVWAGEAGFSDGEIIARFDAFGGTKSAQAVSPRLKLHGMNFRAVSR